MSDPYVTVSLEMSHARVLAILNEYLEGEAPKKEEPAGLPKVQPPDLKVLEDAITFMSAYVNPEAPIWCALKAQYARWNEAVKAAWGEAVDDVLTRANADFEVDDLFTLDPAALKDDLHRVITYFQEPVDSQNPDARFHHGMAIYEWAKRLHEQCENAMGKETS